MTRTFEDLKRVSLGTPGTTGAPNPGVVPGAPLATHVPRARPARATRRHPLLMGVRPCLSLMASVGEARRPLSPPPVPLASRGSDEAAADPVWVAMMDGLHTYMRDHERLYRLLAR